MARVPSIILILFAASSLLSGAGFEFGTRLNSKWPGIEHLGTMTFRGPDGTEDIRLARKTFLARRDNILYLDFEEENPAFLRDAAANFHLQATEYIFSRDAKMGRGAAVFQHPNHIVSIASPDELWPGTKALGDFTIEAWVKPAHFRPESAIIRKVGVLEGRKRGFELLLDGPYLTAVFWNLFTDTEDVRHTVKLRGNAPIPLGKWTHVALAFQARTGKIILIRDGREEDVQVAARKSNLWYASFSGKDRSPIEIGRQFFGAIDDVRIVRGYPNVPDDVDHTPYEKTSNPGSARSAVLFTGRTQASRFHSDVLEPPGTSVVFFVRSATNRFDPKAAEPAWHRVTNGMRLGAGFSYLQWKAELRSDPNGRETPVVREVRIDCEGVPVPYPPQKVRVVPDLSMDGVVTLEWKKGAGSDSYVIYFGGRSGDYTGRLVSRSDKKGLRPIRWEGAMGMPLTPAEKEEMLVRPQALQERLAGLIRVTVTNDMIERNMVQDKRTGRPFRTPIVLETDRAYYFAVASVREDVGTESGLSNEVVTIVRPALDGMEP